MKNFILMAGMLMCFGYASAQQTNPAKQSKTKTDTVHSTSKHSTTKSSTTHKTDTSNQQSGQKDRKAQNSSTTQATSQRKDSVLTDRPNN